ncbi:MAG: hydrogenase maturation protease [Micromonosporaceae bacterium]
MSGTAGGAGRTVVIGIGNEFRRDDGVGPAVIGHLRGQVPAEVELAISDGDPVRLIEMWSGATLAVVVDAVRADPAKPGRIHRFVVDKPGSAGAAAASPGGPGAGQSASTHGLGLDEAIGLAVALGRMPERLIVHAIEAADTTQGTGMTPAVAASIGAAAAAVQSDLLAPP